MVIQVVKAQHNVWYNECVGNCFYVFSLPNSPFKFFSLNLWFYPEDVIVHDNKGALLPMFSMGIS